MLTGYQDVRDRIFALCRERGLRPDFPETTKLGRPLFVWTREQVLVARAFVPMVDDPDPLVLDRLQRDLAHVFGEGWME